MLVEVEVLRYAGAAACCRKLEKGQRPGAESSIDKLYYSEMDKRHQELIQGSWARTASSRAACRPRWR